MPRFAVLAWLCALALVPSARAAVIVVETTADGVSGPLCDLRDAITAANNDAPSGGCTEADPSGDDVIDLSGLTGSIDLDSQPLAPLPTIQSNVTLLGPGADLLRIDGLDAVNLLVVENGTLGVEALTLANGLADGTGRGGCIHVVGGDLVLRDARVTSCSAVIGGALAADEGGSVRIERSLLDANTASDSGAGVSVSESLVQISDSTLSGNVAESSGGALVAYGPHDGGTAGIARIASSTLADNGATSGGNLFTEQIEPFDQLITLTHVLLAAPKAGGNCAGAAVSSQGYNLSDDATCALAATGDLADTEPDLATLGANGGPTATHALLPGSAALDGGNPAGCLDAAGFSLLYDQRGPGFPRRTDADLDGYYDCDIGAFETAPEPLAAAAGLASMLALGLVARARR